MRIRQVLVVTLLLSVVLALAACREAGTETAPGGDVVSGDPSGYPAPGGDQPQIDAYPGPGNGEQTAPGTGTTPDTGATPEPPPGPEATPPSEPVTPTEPEVTAPDATATPLPTAEAIAPPPGTGAFTPGSTVQHTVARGDWLLQVARCYGTSYAAVRDANVLPFPDLIRPGDVLTVPNVGSVGPIIGPPCVVEYTVQPGDTWDGLAAQTGTTAAVLQRANTGPLTAGRVIFLPATSPSTGMLPSVTRPLVSTLRGDSAVRRSAPVHPEVG
jgi:LysM repeat protein